MKRINTHNIIGVIVLLFITSCSNNKIARNKYTISLSNDSLTISSSTQGTNIVCIKRINDSETILYSIQDGIIDTTNSDSVEINFTDKLSLNIIELLKTDNRKYDIALQLIETGKIGFDVKINNDLDTIVYASPSLGKAISNTSLIAHIERGTCAKLEEKGSGKNHIINLRNWLYDNNKPMSDSTIVKMANIVKELNKTTYNEYETFSEIPIIKNFSGLNYNISTNLITDYYYLFAASNDKELDEFIREVVTSGFEMAETNISKPLSCYRVNDKGGLLCIFLVGVNKDWSKQIIPVGLIAVDNINPIVRSASNAFADIEKIRREKEKESKLSNFIVIDSINSKILIPKDAPILTGNVVIDTNDFRGDYANFKFIFDGDIESITIKREIHRSYMRYSLRPETKVINLTDKTSPYYLTYELDLAIGDNYIPITVTDKRGNKTKHNFKISMVRDEDNSSQINIDNNINIYN